MGSGDLLVMMLALPPVGLAGCLRWYVGRAARELDRFRTVLPSTAGEAFGRQELADSLPARH